MPFVSSLTHFTRRGVMGIGLAALLQAARSGPAVAAESCALGAIRWDAWSAPADDAVRKAVQATLGPEKWHARAPSCATVSGALVDFTNCGSQARMDLEISLAKENSISFWAYVWYGASSPMQSAWRLHQSSLIKSRVKWCMISTFYLFAEEIAKSPSSYCDMICDEGYQKSIDGRPIIFLFPDKTDSKIMGSAINAIRSACCSKNKKVPYLVVLNDYKYLSDENLTVDAAGVYNVSNSIPLTRLYGDLAKASKNYWTYLSDRVPAIIPTAMTGLDRRPRMQHPVPWEPDTIERRVDKHFEPGSPNEIAAHIKDMEKWIQANPQKCPSQVGLIYSWNEHDEGGQTLDPTLGEGDSILRAVGKALRS